MFRVRVGTGEFRISDFTGWNSLISDFASQVRAEVTA